MNDDEMPIATDEIELDRMTNGEYELSVTGMGYLRVRLRDGRIVTSSEPLPPNDDARYVGVSVQYYDGCVRVQFTRTIPVRLGHAITLRY